MFKDMQMGSTTLKVDATSLKLDVRLHAHYMNTQSNTKAILCSSDWLMRLELGYFAHSVISGLNANTGTLNRQLFLAAQEEKKDQCNGPRALMKSSAGDISSWLSEIV